MDAADMKKILGHPYIDWILTVAAAAMLAYNHIGGSYFSRNILVLFISWFILFIIISIPLHAIFEVPTNTNYFLRLSSPPA